MFKHSFGSLVLIAALLAGVLTGCAGARDDPRTVTYWASNQGASAEQDLAILNEEFTKFTARTGIKVNVEVIGWGDLLNRILGAATSGVGPDVVNLGNTWSASLQATGAFVPFDEELMRRFGGRERFLDSSMTSTGMPGRTPTALPLYGLSYGLFYDKQRFHEAGITELPGTWSEFLDVAERLTEPERDRWGLTIAGASYTENSHFAFIFGRQEGAHFIDERGRATFTSPEAVTAVQRYTDLMSRYEVVRPDDAELGSATEAVHNFTRGRAAMLLAQNSSIATIEANGMPGERWGVLPMPLPAQQPPGGVPVRSHVAGTNLAVFEDSEKREAALKLVEFLTSKEEQIVLNKKYGSLPVVEDAYTDPEFRTGKKGVFGQVLAEGAETVPMIPNESQFETTVGAAVRDLFARAATGKPVRKADVAAALSDAEQKMLGGGPR
ncbi:extracellular solute-binding protein [Parasphingorhabdus pacifica]